ncbi:MAG: hypothetical protein LBC86_09250 [Oscillospiraceae bacterium]|jgi:hypothetical protein|nr:hypothetical protein [Oscillospiraceae bacterium]
MGKKGIKNILGKKGESLLLVMILMFFFMVICVSVSSAAISGIRYSGMQRDFNQVTLLERSIHDSIIFSLTDEPNNLNSLGWQIINDIRISNGFAGPYIINNIDPDNPAITIHTGGGINAALTQALNNGRIRVQSVSLALPEQRLVTRPAIPALYTVESIPTLCFIADFCTIDEDEECGDGESFVICHYECIWEGMEAHDCDVDICRRTCDSHHNCNIDPMGDPCGDFERRVQHECAADSVCRVPGAHGAIEEGEMRDSTVELITFAAPRTPRSSTILATLEVVVEINSNGTISTSKAVLIYTNGELDDCMRIVGECVPLPLPGAVPPASPECCMKKGEFENIMDFVAGIGGWEFLSYDNILS